MTCYVVHVSRRRGSVIHSSLDMQLCLVLFTLCVYTLLCTRVSLHIRDLLQQRRKPLTAAEFVTPLSKIDPIYKEEEEEFKVGGLESMEIKY